MTKVKDCPECLGCPMRKLFPENNIIPPKMGPSLRLVMVEAPGAEEDIQLEPLVGGSGKISDGLYRRAGVSRDSLTILNTVNCRPPNNLYPTDAGARSYCTEEEGTQIVAHCFTHHVQPVLDSRPWERIDALGEKSLRVLTGKTEGIMKWRGSPLPLIGEDKARVMPTLHPAYLMRDQAMIPAVVSDLKKGLTTPPEFYNLRPTLDELQAFDSRSFTFDIETNRFTSQILMVGISAKPYHVMVVPFHGSYIAELKRIFAQAEEVIGQNLIAFDLPMLAVAGVVVKSTCQLWDTMLMQHLLQPDMPHDLEFIASIFTQKPAWKHQQKADFTLYNARDVDVTAQAFQQLLPLLKMLNLLNLYNDTQVPLAKICKMIHDTGLRTDGARAEVARDKFILEMQGLEEQLPIDLQPHDKNIRIRQPAPPGTLGKSGKPVKFIHVPGVERVVPWHSPKIVEEYLYGTLGFPKQLNAKTKRVSTDKTVLEKLFRKSKNPAIACLQRLRKLDELVSTFFKADNVASGRVYPNLLVHGTSSGRLSSSSPNMQNQPEVARYIYVPSHSDWCFVEADFSQGENRLVAWYAQDHERLARLSEPGFCLAAETKILTADLSWKKISDLQIGEELVGYDENRPPGKGQRKLRSCTVESLIACKAKRYEIVTEKGTLIASAHHRWLATECLEHNTSYRWIETKDLTNKNRIAFLCPPWELDVSREGGLFAGFLAGEGCVNSQTNGLSFSQNPGPTADLMVQIAKDKGFEFGNTKGGKGKFYIYWVRGQAFAALRLLGTFKPPRLLEKAATVWNGRSVYNHKTLKPRILSVKEIGEGNLISLETSTKTFIAEGFLSHNSEHKWNVQQFFGIPYNEVVKDNDKDAPYGKAKRITHGVGYGMGPRKISMLYDLPEKEIRDLLLKWRLANPKTVEWQERTTREAEQTGLLTTSFGRKRWFWTSSVYTESLSFLPQSTLADMSFRAMISLMYERIGWPEERVLRIGVLAPLPKPARLLLQVHDSLLVECPQHLVPEVVLAMRTAMEQPFAALGGFSIPVEFKVGVPGASWGELQPYKVE